MLGCERAGSALRAPPSARTPGAPSAPSTPSCEELAAHGAPSRGAAGRRSVGRTPPNTLPPRCETQHAASEPYPEFSPLRDHIGATTSGGHRGEDVLLRRKRRKNPEPTTPPPGETLGPPGHRAPTLQGPGSAPISRVETSRPRDIITSVDGDTIIEQKYSYDGLLSDKCRADTRRGQGRTDRGGRGLRRALFTILLLLSLRSVSGAGASRLGAGVVCARAAGLTERQRALCRAMPAAMPAIAAGLRMAWAECRVVLAGRRWNCSGVGDHHHFAHVVPLATREAALTYALAAAGVTHALSAACARGDLPACGCKHRRRAEWEGGAGAGGRCGDASYGARLARRFLDARELERDPRALMNLHNNRLGRKMVKELVRVECKCHGVSGSCALRTCWRALPPFAHVARQLRDKYQRARMVVAAERGPAADGRPLVQLLVNRSRRAARRSELVFLAASPSYCEPEPAAAALGTHGRRCNHTSAGPEGCGSLCCGRGHAAVRALERVQCRCSFHWCCRVSCDTCLTSVEYHVCN